MMCVMCWVRCLWQIGKRQLLVVQWSHQHVGSQGPPNGGNEEFSKADFTADILSNSPGEVKEAWQECEQMRKACGKNNGMKKNIAKRLRHNEREAEKFRCAFTSMSYLFSFVLYLLTGGGVSGTSWARASPGRTGGS